MHAPLPSLAVLLPRLTGLLILAVFLMIVGLNFASGCGNGGSCIGAREFLPVLSGERDAPVAVIAQTEQTKAGVSGAVPVQSLAPAPQRPQRDTLRMASR